jgi:hypothetical protein
MSDLAPQHPGPRPAWWRFSARQRWTRRVRRYERDKRHYEVFLLCISRGISMPKVPDWWYDE